MIIAETILWACAAVAVALGLAGICAVIRGHPPEQPELGDDLPHLDPCPWCADATPAVNSDQCNCPGDTPCPSPWCLPRYRKTTS